MKLINLDDMLEGNTYYIQTHNYKFKAIYDKYEKGKFHFKKIIRLNTPKDWCGYIEIHEYMYYTLYESQKTKIQTDMESRGINTIIENLLGHSL
jgi:biotin-(acetyl-CoA carboxylase) ligase